MTSKLKEKTFLGFGLKIVTVFGVIGFFAGGFLEWQLSSSAVWWKIIGFAYLGACLGPVVVILFGICISAFVGETVYFSQRPSDYDPMEDVGPGDD